MKTNDFVKTIVPVAVDVIKDIIKDNKRKIELDKEKSGIDVFRDTDKTVINLNLYINIYTGLGERTKSITGISYADQY